jgi:hypothetical protein
MDPRFVALAPAQLLTVELDALAAAGGLGRLLRAASARISPLVSASGGAKRQIACIAA